MLPWPPPPSVRRAGARRPGSAQLRMGDLQSRGEGGDAGGPTRWRDRCFRGSGTLRRERDHRDPGYRIQTISNGSSTTRGSRRSRRSSATTGARGSRSRWSRSRGQSSMAWIAIGWIASSPRRSRRRTAPRTRRSRCRSSSTTTVLAPLRGEPLGGGGGGEPGHDVGLSEQRVARPRSSHLQAVCSRGSRALGGRARGGVPPEVRAALRDRPGVPGRSPARGRGRASEPVETAIHGAGGAGDRSPGAPGEGGASKRARDPRVGGERGRGLGRAAV